MESSGVLEPGNGKAPFTLNRGWDTGACLLNARAESPGFPPLHDHTLMLTSETHPRTNHMALPKAPGPEAFHHVHREEGESAAPGSSCCLRETSDKYSPPPAKPRKLLQVPFNRFVTHQAVFIFYTG